MANPNRTTSVASPGRPPGGSNGEFRDGNISRKIIACTSCRKHKIKCHMVDSKPPCSRCRRRNFPCTVNRSLQTILEDDVEFKSTVVDKIAIMESTLSQIADKVGLADSSRKSVLHESAEPMNDSTLENNPQPLTHVNDRDNRAWDVTLEGDAVIPGSCVVEATSPYQTTVTNGVTSGRSPDLIEKGLVTLQQAQNLFSVYQGRLDHFLYRILGDDQTFESIKANSPLLIAGICTIGALHADESLSPLFKRCYQEFVALCANKTFSKHNTIDDIRGLCIGAFWLCEISSILIGIAVRIATEMQLHQSIHKALEGDRQSYLQTRLYFLVYVCDHHFSIAYGRPPMSRDIDTANAVADFLELEHSTEDDARLVSQVKIWSIVTRIYDAFGVNVRRTVSTEMIPQLRRLSIALDTWRADWGDRFRPNANVGNYPRKGVNLHFHFAKLYLCSHAIRGLPSSPPALSLGPDLEEIANTAILSAKSILRIITFDTEIQSCLNGLPLYFDTMIAFAAVFLLKISVKYSGVVHVDINEIFSLIDQVVKVLQLTTSEMHTQHLLGHIASGMEKLLERCKGKRRVEPELTSEIGVASNMDLGYPTSLDPSSTDPMDWFSLDSTWLENYDLLSSQAMASGLDSWSLDFNFDQPSGTGFS